MSSPPVTSLKSNSSATTATGMPGDSRTRQTYSPFGAKVYRASYSTTAGPRRSTRNAWDLIFRGVAKLAAPVHCPSPAAQATIGAGTSAASAAGAQIFRPGAGMRSDSRPLVTSKCPRFSPAASAEFSAERSFAEALSRYVVVFPFAAAATKASTPPSIWNGTARPASSNSTNLPGRNFPVSMR